MKIISLAEIEAYYILYGPGGSTNIGENDFRKAGDILIEIADKIKQSRIEAAAYTGAHCAVEQYNKSLNADPKSGSDNSSA